jgi:hypothetical protein
MLEKSDPGKAAKLKWTHRHKPISVSVCSNVPDFMEPVCFVNEDTEKLLEEMIEYMNKIRQKSIELANGMWGDMAEDIEKEIKDLGKKNNDEEDMEVDGISLEDNDYNEERMKQLGSVLTKFKAYMEQIVVLGFNSASYDLNLVKDKLARKLNIHGQDYSFTVKKGNKYSCISTEEFKFLDITNYLAPGNSYSSFLKAYGVEEQKGFFPYTWFDNASKLQNTELPPRQAFDNDMKREVMTEENYQRCQTVWEEKGMKTFKDFLEWYNNLDTLPFVKAVERLQKFYFKKSIDVFKTAISVPGVARQMLFKEAAKQGAEFSIIDEKNKDLYWKIKDNIVGGPSIIFQRHAKKGETKIRKGKTCQKVHGLDANALYLYALGQKMPVGSFVRRKEETGFKPEYRDHYMKMFHYMNYLNKYEGTQIKHKQNCGEEKRIGPYPVDGYDVTTKTVYQFQGCYFHGHSCRLTENVKDEKWLETREEKYKRTEETTKYLKSHGFHVEEMWECDFDLFCQANPKIYDMIFKGRPEFCQRYRRQVTMDQILAGVRKETLFGFVEVDIEVTKEWSREFASKMDMKPEDYFGEMSPIFCNTEVHYDDMGDHMKHHVDTHNLSKKPRRLLVGGMAGEKILLSTPLLKWYLDHGLRVTRVYEVIEYKAQSCFEQFVKEVSDARREGDLRRLVCS